MEIYQELAKKSFSSFKTADHLTYMTFPLIKDNKLILTILENINIALINGMNSILEFERLYKRVSPLPENFDMRYDMFQKLVSRRYDIKLEELSLIRSIKNIIDNHKNSPVEFSRPGKFVICSKDFRMKTVSIDEIKQYLILTKGFLRKVSNIIR